MPTINVHVLRTLLSHGDPSTPPALRAWAKPPSFGDNGGYSTLERLKAVGLTVEALDGLGLAVQGDTLPRLRETQATGGEPAKLSNGEARLATYRNAGHKRSIHYTVNPTTCPSGLRPASIPSSAKADHISAWHQALTLASILATGDTVEIPPLVTGDGTALGSPRSPRVAGPSGAFGRFMGLRSLLGQTISDMAHALETCDDPSAVAPAREALAQWAWQMPGESLDTVTADAFDTTTIRPGSPVAFIDGSPALRVASIVAKANKVELPQHFRVASITDGLATLDIGASTSRPITAKVDQLRRYVAPVQAPVTAGTTWAPTVDGLATYEGEEVLVVSLETDTDGSFATVLHPEAGEFQVKVATLTAPAA